MLSVSTVKERIGLPPNDTLEDSLIQNAITAALSYLTHVYPGEDWTAPSPHQDEGILWMVVALYQEKGRTDGSVDSFQVSVTPMLGRQAAQLLGLDYYYHPVAV